MLTFIKKGSMSFLFLGSHCNSLVVVSWFCKSFQTNGITETVYLQHRTAAHKTKIKAEEGRLGTRDMTTAPELDAMCE
jgi:hypothetical protein